MIGGISHAKCNKRNPGSGCAAMSGLQCYDQAAAAFGWKNRTPQPRSMRDGDWLVGFGCATALYPTHIGAAAARVRLMANGDVRVQTAAHEIGNGVYTVLAQIAAERLGAKLDSVTVEVGDSRLPPAPVAGGSTTTASTCSAVLKTCDAIRSKLFHTAVTSKQGPFAGRDAAALTLNDGKITAADGAEQKLDAVFKGMGVSSIEEYSEFVPHCLEPKARRDH
jgi:xanthine dehydrogenase YagR molybdenum-binding subunit